MFCFPCFSVLNEMNSMNYLSILNDKNNKSLTNSLGLPLILPTEIERITTIQYEWIMKSWRVGRIINNKNIA
jgi:hypothetical protein